MPTVFSFSLPDNHPLNKVLPRMKNRSKKIRKMLSNSVRWEQQYAASKRIYNWLKRRADENGEKVPPYEWFVPELDELGYDTEDSRSE